MISKSENVTVAEMGIIRHLNAILKAFGGCW